MTDVEAPICGYCGVTALPDEEGRGTFVCDNDECPAHGDVVPTTGADSDDDAENE